MMKVITVDDEPLALKQLEMYISKIPYLELIASCRSAKEAWEYVDSGLVDAMFLDINMPGISGLDFVRSLPDPPLVILTTAYPEFALEGFHISAVDYLLKPFGFEEFRKSTEKLLSRFNSLNASAEAQGSAVQKEDSIFFKSEYKTLRVKYDNIRYIEGMSEYVKIHLVDEEVPLVVLMSMKSLAGKLPEESFMRVHKSCIINLKRIKEYNKGIITLDDGTAVHLGDVYRQAFKDYVSRAL